MDVYLFRLSCFPKFTDKSLVAETAVCKPREEKQFGNLVGKKLIKPEAENFNPSSAEVEEMTNFRRVINVSDCGLSKHQLFLLKKRQNFAATPAKVTVDDMITAVDSSQARCVSFWRGS